MVNVILSHSRLSGFFSTDFSFPIYIGHCVLWAFILQIQFFPSSNAVNCVHITLVFLAENGEAIMFWL